VRSLFNLPGYYDLANSPDESTRDPFSHLAFLQQAGRSGGWRNFSRSVMSQAPTTYRLTPQVANQPITGLETGLNGLVESNRVQVAQRTVFVGLGELASRARSWRLKGSALPSFSSAPPPASPATSPPEAPRPRWGGQAA